MAGLGRKVFTAGEVLTAANVNGYLMDQSVMVFADSAARSSAIGTASEGMVTYLADTDELAVWTGSSWDNVNDNTNSVPLDTVTTAGDLIVANGSASVTRLAAGTANSLLYSTGTALSYLSAGTPAQVLSIGTAGALEWADAGGGGSSPWTTLVSSTPLGSVNIRTITGLAGYKDYLLVIKGMKTSTTNQIYLNNKNSGGSSLSGYTIGQPITLDGGASTIKGSGFSGTGVLLSEATSFDTMHSIVYYEGFDGNQNVGRIQSLTSNNENQTGSKPYVSAVIANNPADLNQIEIVQSNGGASFAAGTYEVYAR